MTEETWAHHLADMQEVFNRYIATMREAQDIFETALSTHQNASMNASLKRKRSFFLCRV